MIAGLGTHAALIGAPPAFMCSEEEFQAVQRPPTEGEAPVIFRYQRHYREKFDVWPHGLHYLTFPGEAETFAVWFPLP